MTITVKELYDGVIPNGYTSIETAPTNTSFYTTLCVVGSMSAKVQEMNKMYKLFPYKDKDGNPCGRWMEGDWIKVMCWKVRER